MVGFNEHLARYRQEGIEYLRQNIPKIKRLESFRDLQDVRLIKETSPMDDLLCLEYEASVTKPFPEVMQDMIDSGLVKKLVAPKRREPVLEEPEEQKECRIQMSYYNGRLQVLLTLKK